jgi:hypothetical protein
MTRRLFVSQQEGTNAPPYKVVDRNYSSAEEFVPKTELARVRREALAYAARTAARFSREAADAIRALE